MREQTLHCLAYYRNFSDKVVFRSERNNIPSDVLFMGVLAIVWDSNNLDISVTSKRGAIKIKDLSVLTDEEYFQESLVWESTLDIDFVRAQIVYGKDVINSFEDIGTHAWEGRVQY